MSVEKSAEDRLREANDRLTAELESAAKFQRTLLPVESPSSDRFTSAWFYKPSDEIGGDGLNFFDLGEGRIALYVLDVTGHGVASALLSVTVTHFLSGFVKNHDHCPKQLLENLNRHFSDAKFVGHSFTLVYGVLDTVDSSFIYGSAGHVGPILVMRDGSTAQFEGHGPPIGLFAESEYGRSRIALGPGDRIFLISDGIYEARNPAGVEFSLERVYAHFAKETQNGYPLNYTVQSLARETFHWRNPAKPDDDISVVGVELK